MIQVHLQEVNKTLTFIFSQQIDVLANYEGQPDCYLSLKLAVLPDLKEQANITKLIKQDKLILEGDIQLAQKFAQLISDAKTGCGGMGIACHWGCGRSLFGSGCKECWWLRRASSKKATASSCSGDHRRMASGTWTIGSGLLL